MDYPAAVALARATPTLPTGAGWAYEPKFDGDRCILWRLDTVRLQSRTGRNITAAWPDITTPAMDLPRGTVLDGELVIYLGGVLDFGAVRARASSRGRRLQDLVHRHPASYAAWDILMHDGQDVRALPYTERRALLLAVLGPLGPPLQPVPSTTDPGFAESWMSALAAQGIEGIVAKRLSSTYRPGRIWQKLRLADTVDGQVTGHTGPAARPHHLIVRLPDGRTVRTQRLPSALSAQLGQVLSGHDGESDRTPDGEPYRATTAELTVELLAGTTRHGVYTVTRPR
ncbi:ATP-dependent DNA ligase [Streptomyces sp. SPB074]|uniref:ATP-dependent DNA ligase n=1 Tax=Streptomyces sp. (strain SPB074) TaxID=465543 RepID=UPI00017F0F13|nr:ATP-dependent DNA ligase [Streptomyces sp. SPB074]